MLVLGYKRKNTEGAQEQKGNIRIILCAEKHVLWGGHTLCMESW